ncbi:MAG: FeMo cofactor biosynthesis protein NifB [Candidatus Ordinivivax streblomastigis]|uniref:FeMo cofactor biosynthesis protein NifB n=1 Tax=Candidatus Ordinivivax streblomastigis TaxID=2540710 RepID=A0A5M8NW62_9BACT|nr:MAG: FeMo cofactor biosynthesis protein NifB [Candidatus Ordinivivax streblomastigis]
MYRIAIASNNGESINQHFGQARNFLIYEIGAEGVNFIEDREVSPPQGEAAHSEEYLESIVHLLEDCAAIFVLRIGARSAKYLLLHNIKVFEVDFSLHYIFTTLLKNQQRGKVRIFK